MKQNEVFTMKNGVQFVIKENKRIFLNVKKIEFVDKLEELRELTIEYENEKDVNRKLGLGVCIRNLLMNTVYLVHFDNAILPLVNLNLKDYPELKILFTDEIVVDVSKFGIMENKLNTL